MIRKSISLISANRPKTLFLVSGEKSGEGFWLIGKSDLEDPLKINSKKFIECYRKEIIGADAAEEILNEISESIKIICQKCFREGYALAIPPEGIPFDIPLSVVENIYDFWFETYKNTENWQKFIRLRKIMERISFSSPLMLKGLKGSTQTMAMKLEQLHSFRPLKKHGIRKNWITPMWE